MTYSRRWSGWQFLKTIENLTVLDLINNGTISTKLAGLLWLLMDYRPSVMVAAGPSYAGKTTLLNTLLDFLHPQYRKVHLQGYMEDFKFLELARQDNIYLIAEEISNHSYEYLWGNKARKTFELLQRGYALGTTIHARSVKEVVYILHDYLGLSADLLGCLDVVATLRVTPGKTWEDEPERRLDSLSVLSKTKQGLLIEMLAVYDQKTQSFDFLTDEDVQDVLTRKFPAGNKQPLCGWATRERFLSELGKEKRSREEVRKAIIGFYRSRNK